jgi:hypothetical protein
MRKRSKYKPKGINPDNISYVLSGFRKVATLPVAGIKLLTRNHSALEEILHGRGTHEHVDVLIAAMNMCETLAHMGIGEDWIPEILKAQQAIYNLAQRGISGKKFVFTGPEMSIVKQMMELHDRQLEECTVAQMEKALDVVSEFIRLGKAKKIKALEVV